MGKRAAGKTTATQTGGGFNQYVQGGGGQTLAGADKQGNPVFKQNVARENYEFKSLQLNEVLDPATEKKLFTQLIQTAATGLTAGSQATATTTAQAGQKPAAQQPGAQQSAQPAAQSKAAAQQIIVNQAGIPPQTLAAIEAITGALPAVTSRDAQTIHYLQALGFNVQ